MTRIEQQTPSDSSGVFTLTLRAIPNWSTPPIKRLRAFLKAALRCWGFRCVDVREQSPEATQGAQERRETG